MIHPFPVERSKNLRLLIRDMTKEIVHQLNTAILMKFGVLRCLLVFIREIIRVRKGIVGLRNSIVSMRERNIGVLGSCLLRRFFVFV